MGAIIALTCTSCGAKLEITEDIDRFACAHCGTEHLVKRGGGIVSLAPVVEKLERVHEATSATARELTVARLEREISALQAEASKLARMIAADDITSTAALLNCIGKVGFLRQIQLGTKESSREKDILFCSELLDGLSAEEAFAMQRHYENMLGGSIFKTAGRKARHKNLVRIADLKRQIADHKSEIKRQLGSRPD